MDRREFARAAVAGVALAGVSRVLAPDEQTETLDSDAPDDIYLEDLARCRRALATTLRPLDNPECVFKVLKRMYIKATEGDGSEAAARVFLEFTLGNPPWSLMDYVHRHTSTRGIKKAIEV